jgi:hypothetical protein
VFEEKLKIMHFGSIQINFAWIHVSYFSNFQNELICIDTYELVSIHSSSVWTERYSCIDTCLHASIHASKQLTCIDTNTNLYRYKIVKTGYMSIFHSFIHQQHKNFFFLTVSLQNPHPKILNLSQNSTKFHEINTHSLRIQYPLKSSSLISWSKSHLLQFKEFIKLGFVEISKVLHQKCKVNRSISLSSCNDT